MPQNRDLGATTTKTIIWHPTFILLSFVEKTKHTYCPIHIDYDDWFFIGCIKSITSLPTYHLLSVWFSNIFCVCLRFIAGVIHNNSFKWYSASSACAEGVLLDSPVGGGVFGGSAAGWLSSIFGASYSIWWHLPFHLLSETGGLDLKHRYSNENEAPSSQLTAKIWRSCYEIVTKLLRSWTHWGFLVPHQSPHTHS